MTAEPRCWGGGGGGSHPSQLTTGLVIKSVTTSPTLAGERMLFILQVSILSEQTNNICEKIEQVFKMDNASIRHPPIYKSFLDDSPVCHLPSKVLRVSMNCSRNN